MSSSFVICNEGYTIERFIHGMDADYNDIQEWRHKDLVSVFGGAAKNAKTYTVKTKTEVEKLFADKEFVAAESLQFVELYMPKEDAPRALVLTAEASAKTNAKQ
jgi:pyruvate decarboxylase